MSLFLRAIQEKVEMDEISNTKLGEVAGVSGQAIANFLKGETELNFYSMLKMIRFLFPMEEEQDLMENYILSLEKKEYIRVALEYCSLHNYTYLVDYLLDQEVKSNNKVNVRWAQLYKLFHEMNTKQKPPHTVRQELKLFVIKQPEMYILARMTEAISFRYEGDFRTMLKLSKGLMEEIDNIRNAFIRDSFKTRICLIYSYIYFHANELDTARKYAREVIKLGLSTTYVAKANYHLFFTYCTEDYQMAVHYLNEVKAIYHKIKHQRGLKDVRHDMVFLNNLWKKAEMKTDDIKEMAHREVVKGNNIKALELLNTVEETPFSVYYKGLATGDVERFWKSYQMFLLKGQLCYAELPKKQLLKLGERESAVEIGYKCMTQSIMV